MCQKIRCDGESRKLFGFRGELNKDLDWRWKFSSCHMSKGCREGVLETNKKINYIACLEIASQIY